MTTEKIIKTIPKVLLHDHLDGGLRPQTIIDLAEDQTIINFLQKILMNLQNGFTEEQTKEI